MRIGCTKGGAIGPILTLKLQVKKEVSKIIIISIYVPLAVFLWFLQVAK